MTDLIYIPDHDDRALEDLLVQYRDKPRICAFIRAVAKATQRLEDDLYDYYISASFPLATGIYLDQWGEYVGEKRDGLEDDDYRKIIAGRALLRNMSGSINEMIALYEIYTAPSDVRYFSHDPRGFRLQAIRASFMDDLMRIRVRDRMEEARPAGKRASFTEAIDQRHIILGSATLGLGKRLSRVL